MEEKLNCAHCDKYGSCRLYSNIDVDWPCPGNGDCEDFVEGAEEDG
jgi:hypothetical protein